MSEKIIREGRVQMSDTTWKRLKVASILQDKTVGEIVEEAVNAYLSKTK